jgi:hypothetical protein
LFGLGKLRFRGPDKSRIDDDAHIEDYKNSDSIGRVTLGELCLYYRDLGKKYFVPYPYIDRAFCRISECQPDDSPAYYYYRLILMHGEKEFANHIFNKEEEVDTILQKLPERNPAIKIGFQAPPDGKRKARFS